MVTIESRAAWGARYQDGDQTLSGLATGVRIHHTVTTTLPATATVDQERAQMRTIEATGQQRFGTGISYNVVIFPSGRAYQGVSFNRRGTHDAGENTPTRAICFAGDYSTHQPTDAQIATAAAIVAEGRGKWWTTTAPVTPHSDHYATDCPGNNVRTRLPEIRAGHITPTTPTPEGDFLTMASIDDLTTATRAAQTILVKTPASNAVWQLNLTAGTKRKIANPTQQKFLMALGIKFYDKQAPAILDGLTEVK